MKQKIIEWMENFVEKSNPLLNNWAPCPYARKARINGNIEILEGISVLQDGEFALPMLELKDVVVFYYNNDYDKDSFVEDVKILNESLMPMNYVALEDHPDIVENINGVLMNFGHCPLLFLQKLDKLTEASDKLKEQGYYDTWSKENIDNVVTWRRGPID